MKAAVVAVILALVACAYANEREERIFAYYSTSSITHLTTTTVTGLETCLSVSSAACTGRRKRGLSSKLSELAVKEASVDLEGSKSDEADEDLRAKRDTEKDGRAFTVWSTVYTTLTMTSTSILASTTITASALCSASGLTATCF
ncbi:uncharacterized protein LOC122263399 [Penaeus japonicus]|uniref:uncharacterized protein LOC122263399 n=1 Tax=Penaeus japonicus TaxID=27405 RepID=UPI001C710242|nr:uncharacterized protein LOC122263399 [Penaeus japonicus]